MRHARVIGNHQEELAVALERAERILVRLRSRMRMTVPVCSSAPPGPRGLAADVAPHQHVDRRARPCWWRFPRPQFPSVIIRLEEALARAIHADAARDGDRPRAAHNVAVALDAGDRAGLLEGARRLISALWPGGRRSCASSSGMLDGDVVFSSEQFQNYLPYNSSVGPESAFAAFCGLSSAGLAPPRSRPLSEKLTFRR